MCPTVYSLLVVVALAVLSIHYAEAVSGGTGSLTWGENCNPSASLYDNQSSRCDTSKRLSCDQRNRVCKCHREERDFYNENRDRCETKIGKFCSASDTFPTICALNAVCDSSTNFCVCGLGAKANEEGTECTKEDEDDANSGNNAQVAIISLFAVILGARLF